MQRQSIPGISLKGSRGTGEWFSDYKPLFLLPGDLSSVTIMPVVYHGDGEMLQPLRAIAALAEEAS